MRPHAISFKDEKKITRDSFAPECDINNIVGQYTKTGIINHLPRTAPQYGEAPDLTLHEAACIVAQAATAIEEGWEPTPTEIVDSEASQAVSDDSRGLATPPDADPDAAKGDPSGA